MIRGAAIGALLLALPSVLVAGGCQTVDYSTPGAAMQPAPGPTPMDGAWTSNDGVFVATFASGNFTSRFTQTGEVLAQGTYTVSGTTVNLVWISAATKQQRAATCTMTASDMATCNQQGGGSFDLKRSG
jgi:hypothetical protein